METEAEKMQSLMSMWPQDFLTIPSAEIQRMHTLAALKACKNSKAKTARLICIGRSTLYREIDMLLPKENDPEFPETLIQQTRNDIELSHMLSVLQVSKNITQACATLKISRNSFYRYLAECRTAGNSITKNKASKFIIRPLSIWEKDGGALLAQLKVLCLDGRKTVKLIAREPAFRDVDYRIIERQVAAVRKEARLAQQTAETLRLT